MTNLGKCLAGAALAAAATLLGACSAYDGTGDDEGAESIGATEGALEESPMVDCVIGITEGGTTTMCQACVPQAACEEGTHTSGDISLSVAAYEPCVPDEAAVAALPPLCQHLVLVLQGKHPFVIPRSRWQRLLDKQAEIPPDDDGGMD